MFKTISENASGEIVEKKSKFIANLFYVESVEEAEEKIKEIKKKYYDARHNCFAYSIHNENGNIERFSDDGEPSGTAGSPMLNILKGQNLSNIVVIVTRYFGGILLGTGGLVRSYSEATTRAISNAKIVSKDLGIRVNFLVSYDDLEKIKYYFKTNNIKMLNFEYYEDVKITVEMKHDLYEKIVENKSNLNFNIKASNIEKKVFIEVSDFVNP